MVRVRGEGCPCGSCGGRRCGRKCCGVRRRLIAWIGGLVGRRNVLVGLGSRIVGPVGHVELALVELVLVALVLVVLEPGLAEPELAELAAVEVKLCHFDQYFGNSLIRCCKS